MVPATTTDIPSGPNWPNKIAEPVASSKRPPVVAPTKVRWQECERQIQAIHAGKVVDGDPAELEAKLLDEQDAVEYELGLEYFRQRGQS